MRDLTAFGVRSHLLHALRSGSTFIACPNSLMRETLRHPSPLAAYIVIDGKAIKRKAGATTGGRKKKQKTA
jgi:hypothetical protein